MSEAGVIKQDNLGASKIALVYGQMNEPPGARLRVALSALAVTEYFRDEKNWWAIIPAGVMTAIAIVATLGIAGWIQDAETSGVSNAILMGGLAATFAVLPVSARAADTCALVSRADASALLGQPRRA